MDLILREIKALFVCIEAVEFKLVKLETSCTVSDTSTPVVLPFGHGLFRATRIEALPPNLNLNLTLTVLYTTIT